MAEMVAIRHPESEGLGYVPEENVEFWVKRGYEVVVEQVESSDEQPLAGGESEGTAAPDAENTGSSKGQTAKAGGAGSKAAG